MGNSSSHRNEIPEDELPEFVQLAPNVCVLSFQGYRVNMEDGYHFQVFDRLGMQALAVFDGHSGKGAMEFSRKHLLAHMAYEASAQEISETDITKAFISTERLFKEFNRNACLLAAEREAEILAPSGTASSGTASSGTAPSGTASSGTASIETASASTAPSGPPPLRLNSNSGPLYQPPDRSGTCAIAAILKDGHLTVANAGDCTALLIHKDGSHQVLNTLHRPNSVLIAPYEMQHCSEGMRINEAGLCVQQNRVNGELAVSRSIGDFGYKGMFEEESKHAVTCIPTITRIPITDQFKCLYLYSDGIGDGMEPFQIAEYENAHVHGQPRDSMEALLKLCMEKTRDNITIARIDF